MVSGLMWFLFYFFVCSGHVSLVTHFVVINSVAVDVIFVPKKSMFQGDESDDILCFKVMRPEMNEMCHPCLLFETRAKE